MHIASLNGIPVAKQQRLHDKLQQGEAWLQEAAEALNQGEYSHAHRRLQQAQEVFRMVQDQGMALGLATVVTTIHKKKERRTQQSSPSTPVIVVDAPVVNIRQGAGTNHPILAQVRRGQKLTLLEQANHWYYVEIPSGLRGWIAQELVTVSPP
jgi:uncharacterized protein YraI